MLGSPPPSSTRPGGAGQDGCLGKMDCQSVTWNTGLPVARKGRVIVANAAAS